MCINYIILELKEEDGMQIEKMRKRKHKQSSQVTVKGKKGKKPKGQRSDKPLHSREHAIKRAKERYGMELSLTDVERIEFRIRQYYDVLFLEKSTNTRSIWLTRYDGVLMVAVYNTAQKCLSTFLPQWYAKRYVEGDGLPNYDPSYYKGKRK